MKSGNGVIVSAIVLFFHRTDEHTCWLDEPLNVYQIEGVMAMMGVMTAHRRACPQRMS